MDRFTREIGYWKGSKEGYSPPVNIISDFSKMYYNALIPTDEEKIISRYDAQKIEALTKRLGDDLLLISGDFWGIQKFIFNGVVYILAYNGNLVAIDLLKGQQLWSQDLAGYTDLAISGTTIYLTDSRGHVFALNRDDGKKIWENKELAYRNVTGVAVANEYIVVGDGEGYLHWLSRDDGHFVAQQELDSDGLYVPPLEGEYYLYLQTRSGKLIAIEKPSVQREREFEEAAED